MINCYFCNKTTNETGYCKSCADLYHIPFVWTNNNNNNYISKNITLFEIDPDSIGSSPFYISYLKKTNENSFNLHILNIDDDFDLIFTSKSLFIPDILDQYNKYIILL